MIKPDFISYAQWREENPEQAEATRECWRCNGNGWEKCPDCGGTTKRTCRECGVTETKCVRCEDYGGTLPCSVCDESGEIEIGYELYQAACRKDGLRWQEFHSGAKGKAKARRRVKTMEVANPQ